MSVTTYNPKKVTVALGRHIVSGYADDSFITIDDAGDGTSYLVGCDGEVARSIDPNNVRVIKLVVLQGSATNAFLENMRKKDKEDGNGTFSVSINDIVGGERFSGSIAWVTKSATWTRGKSTNNREWEIVCADGDFK